MIAWNDTTEITPNADVEFIAFNPDSTRRKKSTIIRFGKNFSAEQIRRDLLENGYTKWVYVE